MKAKARKELTLLGFSLDLAFHINNSLSFSVKGTNFDVLSLQNFHFMAAQDKDTLSLSMRREIVGNVQVLFLETTVIWILIKC